MTRAERPAQAPRPDPPEGPPSEPPPEPRQGPRQGPRPLPLHLMAASLAWTSSRAALPLLKSASPPWRPEVQRAAAALQASLEKVDPEAFQGAVERQLHARMAALAEGILSYRRHPYRRKLPDPPVLWRQGTGPGLRRRSPYRTRGC